MQPEVTLTYEDAGGLGRRVFVRAPRFTIGRHTENDLTIGNSKLSRRHAVIDIVDNAVRLTDCDSQNGTTVNGRPVTGAVELRDHDVIALGGACALTVHIQPAVSGGAPPPPQVAAPVSSTGGGRGNAPSHAADHPLSGGGASWLSPPVIAATAIALIIIITGLLIGLSLATGDRGGGRVPTTTTAGEAPGPASDRARPGGSGGEEASSSRRAVPPESPGDGTAVGRSKTAGAADGRSGAEMMQMAKPAPDALTARAVKSVMSRISNDSSPYISAAGVRDVAEQIQNYQDSAALRERIGLMQRGCSEVTGLAQNNNLKPKLVVYAALAQSEGSGDPVAVARQMIPKLLTLRATFGTETANSSLLLVAAYPYPFNPPIGSQARTAHPLASKLMQFGGKKSTEEMSVARSVWFLREHDGITPEAYRLVVRLLAVGVIAQNPRQYGIEADPLLC